VCLFCWGLLAAAALVEPTHYRIFWGITSFVIAALSSTPHYSPPDSSPSSRAKSDAASKKKGRGGKGRKKFFFRFLGYFDGFFENGAFYSFFRFLGYLSEIIFSAFYSFSDF